MRLGAILGVFALAACETPPDRAAAEREARIQKLTPMMEQVVAELAAEWNACLTKAAHEYDDRQSGAEVVARALLLACSSVWPEAASTPGAYDVATGIVLRARAANPR